MESIEPNPSESAATGSRSAPRERLGVALDAVVQAMTSPALSMERVRGVVMRYGALAREQAMQLDEMLQALTRTIRGALDALPTPQRAEVLASVQWWAMHGYHRAD
jgi:hypothetical protein